MLTNQQIAAKWARRWYTVLYRDTSVIELLDTAITDATEQQAERVEDLDQRLRRMHSVCCDVLDVIEGNETLDGARILCDIENQQLYPEDNPSVSTPISADERSEGSAPTENREGGGEG